MSIAYHGIGDTCITMQVGGEVQAGELCGLNANGYICRANGDFIGVVRSIEGEEACVQIGGYAEVACDQITTVSYGNCGLTAADGKAVSDEDGKPRLVLYKRNKTIGFML